LRTELVARIDASGLRLVSDVRDVVVRMLELKPELAKQRDQILTIENNVLLELKPELAKQRDRISTIVKDVAKGGGAAHNQGARIQQWTLPAL